MLHTISREGEMKTYLLAEAARKIGCSERWLRQAEKNGKIPHAIRNVNGWRVYTLEDINRLKELLLGK